MTRLGHSLESLGFGLLAAVVAGAVSGLRDSGDPTFLFWLVGVAGVSAAAVWRLVVALAGPVHLGMAAAAGAIAVVAAYVLGALVLAVFVGIDVGPDPGQMLGAGLGFAMFGLFLTGFYTIPIGVSFAVVYGMASRLWRRVPAAVEG
ncbi:MAG: hypothetical protein PHS60_17660 [Zavarzinia sp.]|nr:hypothetical protein [Zavarzinia sp.]